jgi:hypothetical protein
MTTTHKTLAGLAATIVAGAALLGIVLGRGRGGTPDGPRPPSAMAATVTVERFAMQAGVAYGMTPELLAESLAAALGHMPGLVARTDGAQAGHPPGFVLRGDVSSRDGRAVVVARLYPAGERQAAWTATYWRRGLDSDNLVTDLATSVAEAVYGHLARQAVARPGGTR